jgi:glycosyltransferase involved in cell wall biosynthesis
MAPFTSPTAAAAARRGAPTVVTVHSMWNRMGPLPAAAAAVAGLRQSPVVWTAVSATAARHLADRLPGEQHVMVVPNAVDVRPRTASPTPGRDRPVRLVSTMRIARRKRPLQLLRIFDAVRRSASTPVQLTIVGDGPLRPRATRRLRRDGLEDAVTITGRVEPIEVLRHLHDADVYVAPALLESFGLAALEARCVGLPVVGHAGSGIGEFVQNGVEGCLCARDGDFVDRLLRLVDSADLRHEMSEHNRTTASTMTWPNALDRNDEAYDLALGAADRRLAATTRRR